MVKNPLQTDSSQPVSGNTSPTQPTPPRGSSPVRNARENMSFSTPRSPSLAAHVRHTAANRDREDRRPKSSFSRTLVVSRGIKLQGSIQDAEKVVIEGSLETDHITAKELVIAHGGFFHGTANVETAEISGTLDGELTARTSLCVCTSGRLNGSAACRRLQVDDGGEIIGKLDIITTPQTSQSSSAASTQDLEETESQDD